MPGSDGGGAKRDRTADLLHAMQALSQLSYSPTATCNYSGWRPTAGKPARFPRQRSVQQAMCLRTSFPLSSAARSDHAFRCHCPVVPTTCLSSADLTGRARRACDRQQRRARPRHRNGLRGARRHRGAARPRRAQARSTLRRSACRGASQSRPSCRWIWRAPPPKTSPTSPAHCNRSTDASTPSFTLPSSSARWAPLSTSPSMPGCRRFGWTSSLLSA